MRQAADSSTVILGLAALVAAVTGLLLTSDPLVRAPQLDAAENIALARAILAGTLEAAPFYRGMLYPLAIAGLLAVADSLLLITLFGLACHGLTAWLLYRIGWRLWECRFAAALSAAIFTAYPVSLFYATQALDMTFATLLFAAGIDVLLRKTDSLKGVLVAGFFMGLAILARPHFLPAACSAAALIRPGSTVANGSIRLWRSCALLASVGLLLIVHGLVNWQRSGAFLLLPWQGAFNLWAANKPGANGLYFQQSRDVARRTDTINPAHAESLILFREAWPQAAQPAPIAEMNQHWRRQFRQNARADPAGLLRLWAFKAYAVLNSHEQYNNLTYGFHRERIAPLRWNPLNWGLLLMLATVGWLQLLRQRPRAAIGLLWLAAAYAVSLILYYASGRFRLPLVPLLALAAGGIVPYACNWLQAGGNKTGSHTGNVNLRARLAPLLAAGMMGAVSFSAFGQIRSTATHIQDRLLLANAHAELGEDVAAATWALAVLAEQAERFEAQRIYAVSYFNLQLEGDREVASFGDWQQQRAVIRLQPPTDPALDTIVGFFWWHWGERAAARELWQAIAQHQRSALLDLALHMSEAHAVPSSAFEHTIHRLLLGQQNDQPKHSAN